MTENVRNWCIALVIFFMTTLISFDVMSAGTIYKGGLKPFECINPTALEDGQPVLAEDIDSATMYVLDAAVLGNILLTVPMPGGCTRVEGVDINSIGFGQFYTSATFSLKGGEVSVFADGVPFESRSSARPLPPVIVE